MFNHDLMEDNLMNMETIELLNYDAGSLKIQKNWQMYTVKNVDNNIITTKYTPLPPSLLG